MRPLSGAASSRARATALIVLLAGIGLSAVTAHLWATAASSEVEGRLDAAATLQTTMLEDQTRTYVNALSAEGAFFQTAVGAGRRVTRSDFGAYVAALDLEETHPGMQAMGWQVPVGRSEMPAFLAQARADGPADFAVKPPGVRDESWIVLYNEPAAAFGKTWGFDARTNASVRPYLARARDTGQPTLSGKAVLGVDMALPKAEQPVAFGFFVPVYRAGVPVGSAAARQAAFLGWASSPFRARSFLQETYARTSVTMGVELFDTAVTAANRVSAYPEGFTAAGPHLRTSTVAVGGRNWVLRMSPAPGSPVTVSTVALPLLAFGAGVAISVLLAGLILVVAARTRTVKALAEANAAQADLAAMLSHDVKQPLTAIIGYTETVLEDWDNLPEASRRSYLERSVAAAGRLGTLVDEVLTVARFDEGPVEHRQETVSVAAVLAEAISDIGRGSPVDTSGVEPVSVLGDPGQIRQILTNLLGNALKYGASPVTVTARERGAPVEITVCDGGEGVPAEFVPQLFERFTRANSGTALTRRGTGLGLYIARSLTKGNGGTLTYRAGDAGGACFVLCLPGVPAVTADTRLHAENRHS